MEKPRRNLSHRQRRTMLNFVLKHKKAMNDNSTAYESLLLWEELAKILNDLPGSSKTASQWRRSYKDYKSDIRCKLRKMKNGRGDNSLRFLNEEEQFTCKHLLDLNLEKNPCLQEKPHHTDVEGILHIEDLASSSETPCPSTTTFPLTTTFPSATLLPSATPFPSTTPMGIILHTSTPIIAVKEVAAVMTSEPEIDKKQTEFERNREEDLNSKEDDDEEEIEAHNVNEDMIERQIEVLERQAAATERLATAVERIADVVELYAATNVDTKFASFMLNK